MVKAAVKKLHPLNIKLVEVEGREVVKYVQKRAMHQKTSSFFLSRCLKHLFPVFCL